MAIEHDRGPWGNWLRTIKGSRGPNIVQIGQPIEDQLRGVVQIEDLSHLAEPTRLVAWGHDITLPPVVLDFNVIEIRAVRPFRVFWLQALSDCRLEVADAHLLAVADVVPQTQFSGVPLCRLRAASDLAGGGPDPAALRVEGSGAALVILPLDAHPIFIPRGKIFRLSTPAVNLQLDVSFRVEEVPDPTTVP